LAKISENCDHVTSTPDLRTFFVCPQPRRDPKERLKAEEDSGIVLSPQRRSFLTGCQGSSSAAGHGQQSVSIEIF
jgi:hypothetical protein